MKSYTDLKQSKKLAEILPIESADHHYVRKVQDSMGNPVAGKWSTPKYGNPNSSHASYMSIGFINFEIIPCWSLAALLGVLPEAMLGKDKDGYVLMNETMGSGLVTTSDNSIDACYEMILKLNELKLL